MNRPTHIGGLCRFTRLFLWGVVALQLLSAFATAGKAPDESNTLMKRSCGTLPKSGASALPRERAPKPSITCRQGVGATGLKPRPSEALNSSFHQPANSATLHTEQQESGAGHLPAVRLDGNYFSREGRRFIPVGANWVPAKAAMEWPYEWDPKAIEADFGRMRELGFNTIRLDLVWAWFEPRPDDYNPEAFRQLDFLISLAHRYHIYLHPCFLIGGEVGEAFWDVPYRNGRNPQADPYMLRLETDFASEFARRYGKETAILAWDLTDEPPFWIADQTTDSMAINWTRLLRLRSAVTIPCIP